MPYVPRKRFRSPKSAERARLAAARQRRNRLYEAAVQAGHPKAIEAEFFDSPMKRYYAQGPALPKAERDKLRAECQALVDTPEAKARYLQLRAEVIAEVAAMFS